MGVEFFNKIPDRSYHLSEPSVPPAVYDGRTARMLGIAGQEVTAETHLRLLAGLNPQTGDRLPGMRNVANRQPGWDITFNQHKGLCVLEHVAGDTRIADIRHRSRDKAMAYIEKLVRVAVRKKSQLGEPGEDAAKFPDRKSDNCLWSAFGHCSTRAGDPSGHDHVVLYNLAWDRVEGQFKGAVTRLIGKKEMQKASDIYHGTQAKLLRKIGYEAKWDGKTFSLGGVPQEIIDEFSQRHHAIKAKEAEFDRRAVEAGNKPMASKSRQKLGLHDRPEKAWLPYDERRRGWLSRVSDSQRMGLDRIVAGAKKLLDRDRWRDGLKRHVSRLRTFASHQEHEHVRERGRGR